jgi:hypothetical protein
MSCGQMLDNDRPYPKQTKVLPFFQIMSSLSPTLLLLLIDLGPEIQDPGWIKIRFLNFRKYDSGCSSRIQDPDLGSIS